MTPFPMSKYICLMMKTPGMITYRNPTREKTGGNHYYLKRKDQRLLKRAWTIPSSIVSDIENNWASVEQGLSLPQADFREGQAYGRKNFVKLSTRCHYLQFQMEESSQVLTDQVMLPSTLFSSIKTLEYLRNGSKGSSPALSISKMKAASYPNFGLELLVSEKIWIDDTDLYRVKDFRTHMRILSVVRIKATQDNGNDYLSGNCLRRANPLRTLIAEKDSQEPVS
ncbi:hypothetical protein Tco_0946021 [Tanacetum coccineum]